MARCFRPGSAQAFFSLDAAAWLSLAVFLFASFSVLLSSAAARTGAEAGETSGSLLALRLSSYLLDETGCGTGGIGSGAYCAANEIDLQRLSVLDLRGLAAGVGRTFMGVYVEGSGSRMFAAEEGEKGREVFCAVRLALADGKFARMRVCVS